MKALVWEGPRQLHLRDREVPDLGPGEVRVRVTRVGICGSELSGYLGHNALRVPPLVMGHEIAGTVAELGPGVAADFPGLHPEQRVVVNPLSSCGTCDLCAQGQPHLCPRRRLLGAHRPGGFAQFVDVPAEQVHGLPGGLSETEGALAEPVAVAVRLAELAGEVTGQDLLVLGAGPIGTLAVQTLLASGAGRVFITDRSAERLELARRVGGRPLEPGDVVERVRAETGGRGVAAAVDAVGSAQTRAQCVAATRSGGTVLLSGLHEEHGDFPAAEVIRREILVRGSFAYTPGNFARALALLGRGAVHLEGVREAPLDEGGLWFERLLSAPGDVSKVVLIPEGP